MFLFLERISPYNIIRNHVCTFYNNRVPGKLNYVEIIIWVSLPFILSGLMCFSFQIIITEKFANSLFSAFSIFGGFFINALVLLATRKEKDTLLNETFHNTSFGILICLLIVVLTAVYNILPMHKLNVFGFEKSYQEIFSFIIYYLSLMFLHTLMMVLKRLNSVLMNE